MNPKKPKTRKSKSAGISLEPDLIKLGRGFAEENGFHNLSNLVRFLLTQELKKASGESSFSLLESGEKGKAAPQKKSGECAGNILKPFDGGCEPPPQKTNKAKAQAKSLK